jgi:hypothetical protein
MVEDLALMRYTFGRTGDRSRHAEPLLQQMPVAFVVFELCDVQLVWQGGRHRVPAPCPACGVTRLTRSGHYVLIFTGGGVFDISGGRNQPHRVTCSACDKAIDVLALLDDLNFSAGERDALLDGPFRKYAPTMGMWIAAESETGRHSVARTAAAALNELLGPTYEPEQRLVRIECFSLEQAQRLVAEHSKDMPWKQVQIDSHTLEPLDPYWHGGPLAEWELRKIEDGKVAARIIETKALDVELEQIRRRRLAELV